MKSQSLNAPSDKIESELRELIRPLAESGQGEKVKELTVKHGGTKLADIPPQAHAAFIKDVELAIAQNNLRTNLASQEKLMKAAQKFAFAFDNNRKWPDENSRLSYTLAVWRELAFAAMEFSKTASVEP